MITIGNGKVEYSLEEAQRVLTGYAFGQTGLRWNNAVPYSLGDNPAAAERRRYAYQSYDCVAASNGDLDMADILVTTGLNSGVDAETILAVHAVAPEISVELAQLPPELTFWDLKEEEVSEPPPRPDTRAWPMWRAWWLVTGVPGVGVAVAHKTLHHKRPRLFPLLDNQTVSYYDVGKAWAGIHRELLDQRGAFAELEAWFSKLASARGGVPLSRLRLHDILLWCGRNNRQTAGDLGRDVL